MITIKQIAVAFATTLSLAAHANDDSLYSLQPCPNVLADQNATEPSKAWDLTLSPYTHHWKRSDEHKNVFLVALDRRLSGNRFCGLALFNNSFGQSSAYAYIGQAWDGLWGNPKLFTKISAGLIYGYRDEHKEAIAFNQYGVAPAIIPSLGYAFNSQESAQVFLLGTAGVLFAYGRRF